jgi:hypothetical protein
VTIKRMKYFKGEFLNQEDFEVEQSYHVEMLRNHNKNLHSYGIAEGLDVPVDIGSKEVKVTSGMAIDAQGRQIVQDSDVSIPIINTTETELYLTISYYQDETDSRDDNTGVGPNFTRIVENPCIKFYEKGDFDKLDPSLYFLLAKVTLDNNKSVSDIDKNGRILAGVRGTLAANSITLSVENAVQSNWPTLKGIGANKLEIVAENELQINSNQTTLSGSLKAEALDGDGSSITGLDGKHIKAGTISHDNLSDIRPVDPGSNDKNKDKHISDDLASGWQKHITDTSNPHHTTAAQLGDYLNLKIVNLTFGQGDDDGKAKQSEDPLGFVPKLVLISGAYTFDLGGSSYGSVVSGFWTKAQGNWCSSFEVNKSNTDTSITASVITSAFYMKGAFVGSGKQINETVQGTIDIQDDKLTVTLHRNKSSDNRLDNFTIGLLMLCIG